MSPCHDYGPPSSPDQPHCVHPSPCTHLSLLLWSDVPPAPVFGRPSRPAKGQSSESQKESKWCCSTYLTMTAIRTPSQIRRQDPKFAPYQVWTTARPSRKAPNELVCDRITEVGKGAPAATAAAEHTKIASEDRTPSRQPTAASASNLVWRVGRTQEAANQLPLRRTETARHLVWRVGRTLEAANLGSTRCPGSGA